MIKSKNYFLYFLTIAILTLLIVLAFPFTTCFNYKASTFFDNTTFAYGDTLNGQINVSLLSREGTDIPLTEPESYNDSQVYTILWEEASEFTISFTTDPSNPPPLNTADPDNPYTYQIKLSVRYLKGYTFDDQGNETDFDTAGDTVTFSEAFISPIVSDYTNLSKYLFTFDIDKHFSVDGNGDGDYFDEEDVAINWGIYQFVVDINGAVQHSEFYFIKPNTNNTVVPIVDYIVTTSAMESLTNSFEFYLVNDSSFNYIDENQLVWYAYGVTTDGMRYALSQSDLEDEDFAQYECNAYLYQTPFRIGREFVFEVPNNLTGEWYVWCVYGPDSINALQSQPQTVSTEKPFDYTNVIYIILGGCGLALIVVILVGVYKKKKEKVW